MGRRFFRLPSVANSPVPLKEVGVIDQGEGNLNCKGVNHKGGGLKEAIGGE